jgi:hypothetical protein
MTSLGNVVLRRRGTWVVEGWLHTRSFFSGALALGCEAVPDPNETEATGFALEWSGGVAADSTATVGAKSCIGKFSPLAVGRNSAAGTPIW